MPTLYSDQITNARAQAAGTAYALESGLVTTGGKERIAFFSFLTTGSAQNDVVQLTKLPKGARILGGNIISEALGTNVTLAIGTDLALADGSSAATAIAAAADNLLAATSHASAANTPFAATFALGAGALCANGETTLSATIGGANPTTAKKVIGWVKYVQN